MGNKTSNNYTLEKFVFDVNNKDLQNLKDSELKEKLEMLLESFKFDENLFTSQLESENNIGKQDGEETKSEEFISIQFCNLITFLLKKSFSKEYETNYILIMNIMNLLCKLQLINYHSEAKSFHDLPYEQRNGNAL